MGQYFIKILFTIEGLLVLLGCADGEGCGGLKKNLKLGDGGVIKSPNYPANYPNSAHCVWMFAAETDFAVSLSIPSFLGEADTGPGNTTCLDYLEVRNGSSQAELLYHECSSAVSVMVSGRWIWVQFRSNYINRNTGFIASWTVIEDNTGTSSSQSPYVECPMEFRCENKECVPHAYRCDGYNDCGCDNGKCDELVCDGFGYDISTTMGIGIGAGTGFFILIFFGIGLLDICLKKRQERKYQERMEKHKRLVKQKKAQAMASLFVTQNSHAGSGSRSGSIGTQGSKVPSRLPSVSDQGVLKVPGNNKTSASILAASKA